VTNVTQYGTGRRALAEPAATPVLPSFKSASSAMRADVALLVSSLFLQRFSLAYGQTVLSIGFVFSALIFVHQFTTGRVFINYERLLYFLVLVVAATSSLLLNLNRTRTTSYGLFVLIYSLFTFSHSSTPDQYKDTLRCFQFLVFILSCLAIAQFGAQFVVNGRQLIMFFGIIPDFFYNEQVNTIATIGGSSLIRSNGIFLTEASTMSQIAALAIVMEILVFRRRRYLIVITLGLLLAYSGTGLSILVVALPFAVFSNRRAQLPALLVSLLAVGLFTTGIIQLSAFTSRVGEFGDTGASGFMRFVSPFWMAADYINTASLAEFLLGKGPGYGYIRAAFYSTYSDTWFKLFLEYGLFGAFVFTVFFLSCFRRSRCPKPVIIGLIYHYLFTGNNLLSTSLLTIMVVLCTLSGPEPRPVRIESGARL
jgi:hypothetical protein